MAGVPTRELPFDSLYYFLFIFYWSQIFPITVTKELTYARVQTLERDFEFRACYRNINESCRPEATSNGEVIEWSRVEECCR